MIQILLVALPSCASSGYSAETGLHAGFTLREVPGGGRERRGIVPARATSTRGPLHRHFGGRPRRRAGAHVRGPHSCAPRRAGAAHHRDAAGPSGLAVRRPDLHPGRHERGGRPPPGDRSARAVPVRADAPGLLRHRGPHQGHGHQRRLGIGELPVDDHRLLRPGVLQRAGPRARHRVHQGVERLALSTSGTSRIPTRIMPIGITFLADPELAVAEIRRNAERGFTVGDLPRAAAPDRPAVAVGSRPLGPDHPGLRRNRHGDLPARRQLRHGDPHRQVRPRCSSVPRCSVSYH